MYFIFFLFLLANTAFAALQSPAVLFSGCQSSHPGTTQVSIGGNATGFQSSTDCNKVCYQQNQAGATYNKSFFQKQNGTCGCSTSYGSPPELTYGNINSCTPSDYETEIISSSFTHQGCFATMPSGLTSISKTGPNGCLVSCAKFKQAGFYGDPAVSTSAYQCYCGDGLYTNQVQCGPKTYFVYQHSLADASAGLARRRRQEQYDAKQMKYTPCPKGFTACLINGFTSTDSYECIDTSSDLESCGGCNHGTYHDAKAVQGQDCSTGAALGRSTCMAGKCYIDKCKKGFKLVNQRCVAIK